MAEGKTSCRKVSGIEIGEKDGIRLQQEIEL